MFHYAIVLASVVNSLVQVKGGIEAGVSEPPSIVNETSFNQGGNCKDRSNMRQSMYGVELNHIYLVVDRETYEAIKSSDLIRSLAFTCEQKSTADNQIGWEGFYMRGKNTYIEFFYPQERYPSVGISGIGMGVDRKGILDKMQEDLPHFTKGCFSRNGKPWFNYIAVGDSYFYKRNSFWIMEYAPEYFAEDPEDVSRAHYNFEKYDQDKPFLDIEKVSIALKNEGLEVLSGYLGDLGLLKKERSYVTSENIEVQLLEENEQQEGICQIHFSLSKDFEKSGSYRLGNSILTLRENRGSWSFYKE